MINADFISLTAETHAIDAPCRLDEHGHCATCADEALPATVLHVDEACGVAVVNVAGETREVDITLIDEVQPGAILLIHGGVALEVANNRE